jgi:Rhs element Vgr protein
VKRRIGRGAFSCGVDYSALSGIRSLQKVAMADSPLTGADGALRVTVSSEGLALPDAVQLLSLTVHRAANCVPTARLVFADGDAATASFPVSDAAHFLPGAVIRVCAGYGDNEACIFEGIVIKHAVQISDNASRLIVECHDKVVKMTVGRKNANHVAKKDSDIIDALISSHQLSSDVDATTVHHASLVQFYCTDWDFMLARAEANGLLVIATDGHVSAKAPNVSSTPTLKLSYGVDLIAFEAELDARTQFASVQAVSWDMASQAAIGGDEAGPATLNDQGNLGSATLAAVVRLAGLRLQTAAAQTKEELTLWAKAAQLKSGLARIRGRMSFQGSAKAAVGAVIELVGVGERFSGNAIVGAVTHNISNGNWVTEVEMGLPPQSFTEQLDISARRAASPLPGVQGLQIGVVMKLDGDPQGEHRVLVKLPVLLVEAEGVWARLMQFHGSAGFGAFFAPEVGDEVVLGSFDHDPSHPVILGSLYSSKRAPACALDGENNIKAIVTRCQSKIEFNDLDKSIVVTTPGENRVVLSDEGQSIRLKDQSGNTVELNTSGIILNSAADITLMAQGKITLDAADTVSITSKADVKTVGLNIVSDAEVRFIAAGNARAELSSQGQTAVKGALVLIN